LRLFGLCLRRLDGCDGRGTLLDHNGFDGCFSFDDRLRLDDRVRQPRRFNLTSLCDLGRLGNDFGSRGDDLRRGRFNVGDFDGRRDLFDPGGFDLVRLDRGRCLLDGGNGGGLFGDGLRY
jgi:hypothetical protein